MSDDAALERFRELLRIPTVSRSDPAEEDRAAFTAFRDALSRLYPLAHERLEREVVDHEGLLYRWPGTGGGPASVLMAHHDVVPADGPGWTTPPFAAERDGDRIRSRGAIDDKGMLVALLEAVETLLAADFAPVADVYLYSGADEETRGAGAAAAAELLRSRGVSVGLVLDEGGAVAGDAFPGVTGPVAYVGVAEKGIASIRLTVEKPGGHAATPAANGATTTLARAILRLEQNPAPTSLTAPVAAMLRAIAPLATGLQRTLFSRPEIFRPFLVRALAARGGEGAAMVRTMRAVTRLTGSAADNVIAERATAVVNTRIAIGSSVDEAAEQIRRVVGDDVRVEVMGGSDPSPVSPDAGPAWEVLVSAIRDTFPEATVAPYVMLQASDSRRFTGISSTVYRFLPFELAKAERATLHAVNESIGIDNWLRGIVFFETLLRRL
ncbi:MAG: M20/M25/M40 family metallo-hydrolase [Schumannella sp.]|nr:M20/M25/M40 family metallo-hydrolase [Microbacteriaceae bacterium]